MRGELRPPLHVTAEMLDFLKSLNQYIVLKGRDEKSLVYLLPAQLRQIDPQNAGLMNERAVLEK